MTVHAKKTRLDDAKRAKKDEFYTQLADIERALSPRPRRSSTVASQGRHWPSIKQRRLARTS